MGDNKILNTELQRFAAHAYREAAAAFNQLPHIQCLPELFFDPENKDGHFVYDPSIPRGILRCKIG